jgi:hypothetical protein
VAKGLCGMKPGQNTLASRVAVERFSDPGEALAEWAYLAPSSPISVYPVPMCVAAGRWI